MPPHSVCVMVLSTQAGLEGQASHSVPSPGQREARPVSGGPPPVLQALGGRSWRFLFVPPGRAARASFSPLIPACPGQPVRPCPALLSRFRLWPERATW